MSPHAYLTSEESTRIGPHLSHRACGGRATVRGGSDRISCRRAREVRRGAAERVAQRAAERVSKLDHGCPILKGAAFHM